MNLENQSRPTADTEERHTQTIDHGENTTTATPCQVFIRDLLPRGHENAVTARQLSRTTGLCSREIRRRIAAERAAGAVILTDGAAGYFLPSDNAQCGRDEVSAWLARITARGVSTLRAGDSARAWLSVLPGQAEIGGGDK